jgi:hypothetical protein
MDEKQNNEQPGRNQPLKDNPSALKVVSEYAAAVAAGDNEKMNALRSLSRVRRT